MKAMTETQRQAALSEAMRRITATVGARLDGDPDATRLNKLAQRDYEAAKNAPVVYLSETLKRYCTIPAEDRREYVPAAPARRGDGQRYPLLGRRAI